MTSPDPPRTRWPSEAPPSSSLRSWRSGSRSGGDRPDPQRLAVAFAAGVVAVLAFGKVLSPQYAEWLLFLVPLAAGAPGVAAAALAGAAFLLAELWFHHYDRVFAVEGIVWLVLLRNLALVACYGVLLAVLLRRGTVSTT